MTEPTEPQDSPGQLYSGVGENPKPIGRVNIPGGDNTRAIGWRYRTTEGWPALHKLPLDPLTQAAETEKLKEEVRLLKSEVNHHKGNVIEAYAIHCTRHLPHIRGCAYSDRTPCLCRAEVASRWPEYSNG